MIQAADIQQFKDALTGARSVFLCSHVGPDGDTLGSMLALYHTLKASFPEIERLDAGVSGTIPVLYDFMPGLQDVRNTESAELLPQYDLAVCLDCGSAERLGASKGPFLAAKKSMNIDHHISNDRFGTVNIIDADAGASGEVVADLLFGNDVPISTDAAICLYIAILTDTGGFKYGSTSAKIFDLAAHLTRQGADPEALYRRIYDACPKAQAMLQAEALRLTQFNENETLAWVNVSQALLAQYGAKEEHIEGLVELLRKIDTVKVSAVLRETRNGVTKVSLRSDTHDINVAEVMARWGGGGHKMAAGCTIETTLTEAEALLLPVLRAVVSPDAQPSVA